MKFSGTWLWGTGFGVLLLGVAATSPAQFGLPGMEPMPGQMPGQAAEEDPAARFNLEPLPADMPVDVQIGAEVPGAPHPTTYVYNAEPEYVTDPGPYFYHFFYVGTVLPDGRIEPGSKVDRIPIRLNDWKKHRQWLIARLSNFYQLSSNAPSTAYEDYRKAQAAPEELMAIATPTPTPTPVPAAPSFENMSPEEAMMMGGLPAPGDDFVTGGFGGPEMPGAGFGGGFGGGFSGGSFDTNAAAEWTLYFDQYVMWQYYCQRVLINDASDALIDGTEESAPSTPQEMLTAMALGSMGLDTNQLSRSGGINSAATMGLDANLVSAFGGTTGSNQPKTYTVREVFDAQAFYENPEKPLEWRDKFMQKTEETETSLYKQFVGMVDRINNREASQQKFEEWSAGREQNLYNFAEDFRKLKEGESKVIGNTLFLITEEPMDSPPVDAINITRGKQLTPQDLLNVDGTVKQPLVQ